MIRTELHTEFSWRNTQASSKKKEPVASQNEHYSRSETGRRVTFTFNDYISISSERFVSEASELLQQGKIVEIDCGYWGESWWGKGHDDEVPEIYYGIFQPPKNPNGREWTKFIASKVLNSDVIERISRQGGDGKDLEVDLRFFYNKGRHWWSVQPRHLFIVIEKANLRNNNISSNTSSFASGSVPFEGLAETRGNSNQNKPDSINNSNVYLDSFDFEVGSGSRYSNASVLEINGPIFFADLRNLVDKKGIIEIKRTDFSGVPETYGMFVEKGLGKNEIIINLNGQDEAHFEDIFTPIVLYFLQNGKTVLVEWWGPEEIDLLQDRVDHSEIYTSISGKTGCVPKAERLVISPVGEEDTFIRLELNSLL